MLDLNKTCLTVIDVQGKLAQLMFDKDALFRNLSILVRGFQLLDRPVLWCQQNPAALGETIPEVAGPLAGQEPFNKMCFSCCGHEGFMKNLHDTAAKQVVLCGIETHICVYQTAMDLLDMDYEVFIAADAVSSRAERNRDIALNRLALEGAGRASTEMILFEMMRTADHPRFREIARLVK